MPANKPWHSTLIPLVIFFSGTVARADATAALGAILPEADSYLRTEMQNRSIPGLAVAIVRNGRISATQTYGLANVELNVPVTLESLFPIASLDKQLTATGIMLLVEDGKVRLQDEISQYFDDAPSSWKYIRVRHLLSHASGLPDEVAPSVEGRWLTKYTTEQLLGNVKRQALLFPPGTAFEYSDANFFLAQLIIEKASGLPWRTFVAQRVFARAGMTSATFMDPASVIRNRVSGYRLSASNQIVSNRRSSTDFGPLYNDIGATVIDFAHWAVALETNQVLPRSARDLMWTPQAHPTEGFMPRDYGFGWASDSIHGVRFVVHPGHTGVAILIVPEYRFSVILFTNLDNSSGTDSASLALGVAGFYVPVISLLGMAAQTDHSPGRTEHVRDALMELVRGQPDYSRYVPGIHRSVLKTSNWLVARAPYFREFQSIAYLGDERQDGETLMYYRAEFLKARLFVRMNFDGQGRISAMRLVHL